MIPKDIKQYSLDAKFDWLNIPQVERVTTPIYLYHYVEDSCYRVAYGRCFKKFRGINPETIDKTQKEVLIDEYKIGIERFVDETNIGFGVVITKEEYERFSNVFTPWNKTLLRLIYEDCTESGSLIDYHTLGGLFYEKDTSPLTIINDVRAIKGLAPITPSRKR